MNRILITTVLASFFMGASILNRVATYGQSSHRPAGGAGNPDNPDNLFQ